MATSIKQSDFVKTALRVPPELHRWLHEAAQTSGRSYNGEIVARLQQSFETNESALVLDQSKQIWNMRALIALLHLHLSWARHLFKDGEQPDKSYLTNVETALQRSQPYAQDVIDMTKDEIEAAKARFKKIK